MEYVNVLKELCTYTAVSGYEKDMAENVKNLFKKYCDSVEVDRFYDVIGKKAGTANGKYKIMITAHYDEIGMIVRGIEDEGFLRVTNMGGIDSKILLAQVVIVHGKSKITGIIGAKPPHLLKPEETKRAVKFEDIYIDTGMKADKLKESVSVGDLVTFKPDFLELRGSMVSSKTIDNRCGVATLLGIMEELAKVRHEADIYFVATSQEETHCTGAEIVSYNLRPDIAIVVDACHGDMPEVSKDESHALGKGPAIGLGPNLHRKLTKRLIDICKNENVPYQIDVEPDDTGTEAWVTQVSRSGIPSLLISIPVRYMHTTVETVNIDDIKSAARMVTAFVKEIEPEKEGVMCL
jgi:tetrahedral aminopeptidase